MFASLASWLGRIASIVILIILLSFVLSNRTGIDVSLFPFPYSVVTPLYIIVFTSIIIGLLCGFVLGRKKMLKLKKERKENRKKLDALENEIKALRAQTTPPPKPEAIALPNT